MEESFMETAVADQLESIYQNTVATGEGTICVLQHLQEEFGYINEECIDWFAQKTGISAATYFGVVTFYSQFHLKPRGKNIITVCSGTVCHVRGASKIISNLKENLKLENDQDTTRDKQFTLECVNCVGACSIAPVVAINDQVHGKQSPAKIVKAVNELKAIEKAQG